MECKNCNFKAIQIQGVTANEFVGLIKQELKTLLPKADAKTAAEKLLTRNETAKLLGISLVTLHNWTNHGTLKAYRIGNLVRYKENEVIQALIPLSNRKNK